MTREGLDDLIAEARADAGSGAHGYAYADTPKGRLRCRYQREGEPPEAWMRFRKGPHFFLNGVWVRQRDLLSA